jgi:protease-4
VRALIDQGPFLPDEALRVGLVDDLAYADQIDDKLKLAAASCIAPRGQRLRQSGCGLAPPQIRGPRIAVIYAHRRDLVRPRRLRSVSSGRRARAETIIEAHQGGAKRTRPVRAYRAAHRQPGGSATASDAIWRELVITRESAHDRPLVVSMSDLAAFGRLLDRHAAPYIVAQARHAHWDPSASSPARW